MAPALRSSRVVLVDESQPVNEDQRANREATKDISRKWERQAISLPSSRPLRNGGNRCYRNAVLQALLHIPKLVNWMEIKHKKCVILDCTLCWFKGLCNEYWNQPSNPRAVNFELISLEDNLGRTHAFENWNFDVQNDAGEFVVTFMNAILETNPGIEKLMNSMLGHIPMSTKKCSICNLRTKKAKPEEQGRVLLVGWESPMTLEHILRDQTFSDSLFQLECETCDRKQEIFRTERLWTTPDVLIIQLKRFRMNEKTMRKNIDAVPYPAELDLTEFSETNMQLLYGLQAVVHHRGSLDGGHYITVAKGPRGRWELINDMNRPQMRNVPIAAALSPEKQYTPYLLFYVKLEGRGVHRAKKSVLAAGPSKNAKNTGTKLAKAPTMVTKVQKKSCKKRKKKTRKH